MIRIIKNAEIFNNIDFLRLHKRNIRVANFQFPQKKQFSEKLKKFCIVY